MNTRITRRRLMAGAAALPIAAVLPATTHAEPVAAPATKPDISEIPGLDQIKSATMLAVVKTVDGRMATLELEFNGFGGVDAHLIAPGHIGPVNHVQGDGLDSLPTWLQKELGYACLAAGSRKERAR